MLKLIILFFISCCWAQEKPLNKQTILLSVFKQYTLYSISYEYLYNDDYSYDIGVFPVRLDDNIFPVTTLAIKRHFTDKKRYHIGVGTTIYKDVTLFQLLLGLKSSAYLGFRMQFEINVGLGSREFYDLYIYNGITLRTLPSLALGYSF